MSLTGHRNCRAPQASHDPLTGVFNRRAFAMLAEREIAHVRRSAEPLAALMMDLDHFKQINDRFGHAFGDQALCRFAAQVAEVLRGEDIFCRYGGEEFVALLPRSSASAASVVAERVREAFARDSSDTISPPLTVSIGVAVFDAGDDVESLLQRADAALYRAKAAGRNRVELAVNGETHDGSPLGEGGVVALERGGL